MKNHLIFDTNYLYSHNKDLDERVKELRNQYDVFTTDVSMNERVHGEYGKLQRKYNEITNAKRELHQFATVKEKRPFIESFALEKDKMQNALTTIFGQEHIIPFDSNEDSFSAIIDRAYKHIPPFPCFASDNKQSDKGFKDTLIWFSLLTFYESNTDDTIQVFFITDDSVFMNNEGILKEEFFQKTRKSISFFKNEFIPGFERRERYISGTTDDSSISKESTGLTELRETIAKVVQSICEVVQTNEYDEFWTEKSFVSYTLFTVENLEESFKKMRDRISIHLYECDLDPSIIWGEEFYIVDKHRVPIHYAEELHELYENIRLSNPEGLPRLFQAISEKANHNYEDIPF